MISFVNYNKGAAILASRNTQIIATIYTVLGPVVLHFINDYIFGIPETTVTYISIIIVSTGVVVYILNFALLAFTMLSFGHLDKIGKSKEG